MTKDSVTVIWQNKSACELNQTLFPHSKESERKQSVTMMLSHTHGEKSKVHDNASLKAPAVLLHGQSNRINTFYVQITTNGIQNMSILKKTRLLVILNIT